MKIFRQIEAEIDHYLIPPSLPNNHDNLLLLKRAQKLAHAVGNPQKSLKIIHVAGTSGKTSTCYFAAAQLHAAGHKVGLTVSPHIDSIRERAMINLQPLSESDWVAEVGTFFKLVKASGIRPSYFEFYMCFAFWLFKKHQVDYAVIETGLGGTWDASNIATQPSKICVITDIGLDHTAILGEDLSTIASEKANIIHRYNPTFIYRQSPEIMRPIRARAQLMQAPLHVLDPKTPHFMARNFNLALAAASFALKRDRHPPLTKTQIATARKTLVPARAEPATHKDKTIIMDGSHNPQKIQAFVEYLDHKYPSTSRILLVSLGANKLPTLQPNIKLLRQINDHIILTGFTKHDSETDHRSSIPPDLLLSAAQSANFTSIQFIEDPCQAFQAALESPAQQIVITGSFYLLNHIRPLLTSSPQVI